MEQNSDQAAHSSSSDASIRLIQPGDTVLVKLPNREVRSLPLEAKSSANFGKYGAFPVKELVGKPYGFTYEIVDKKLFIIPPETIEELEETEATNELINDGVSNQPLTSQEIEALKSSGAHVDDIIRKQIELHANYELKTEYSKDKYKKRKEAKFSKRVTIIQPTIFNVCEYWFAKDHNRVRDLRVDSLSQIMSLSSLRSGGRYIIVDDSGGLILAAAIDRLGGEGRLLAISDLSHAASYPCLVNMNFTPEQLSVLGPELNWLHTEPDWVPINDFTEPVDGAEDTPTTNAGTDGPPPAKRQRKLERENARVQKRRETALGIKNTREELFAGEWDGLIIASQYEPWSIIEKLYPYLAGSASIVVQSPYLQTLADVQQQMRKTSGYLAPMVSEAFTREYQVLPGRTHPTMSTSGSGGFLLHAIKIYDDKTGVSTRIADRRLQRQKMAEAKRKKRENENAAQAQTAEQDRPSPSSLSSADMDAVMSIL